jgi:hypothetical protein
MKRLYFRILYLVLFLPLQSFCRWDEGSFAQLKRLLRGRGPFCVICVARTGLVPLNSLDILFLKQIIAGIVKGRLKLNISFEEKAEEIMNPLKQYSPDVFDKYRKSDSIVSKLGAETFLRKKIDEYVEIFSQVAPQMIENLKNNPGIIVFSEYFFGTEPIPDDIAKQMALRFASPHKIAACNFVTQSEYMQEETEIETEISKFVKYRSILSNGDNGNKRCDTCAEVGRQRKLENKTFFTYNNGVLMTYKKSTYSREKTQNIENLLGHFAYYSFGEWQPDLNPQSSLRSLQRVLWSKDSPHNISPQICLDYCFGRSSPYSYFQLIQSNQINSPLVDRGGQEPLNKSKYLIFCDYQLATPGSIVQENVPGSMYYGCPDNEKLSPLFCLNQDNEQYEAVRPDKIIRFKLNDEDFVITINLITP